MTRVRCWCRRRRRDADTAMGTPDRMIVPAPGRRRPPRRADDGWSARGRKRGGKIGKPYVCVNQSVVAGERVVWKLGWRTFWTGDVCVRLCVCVGLCIVFLALIPTGARGHRITACQDGGRRVA